MQQQGLSDLDHMLASCIEGDPRALEDFFRHFLQAQWWVPDRHQGRSIHPSPTYPNDLVSLLGVPAGEGVTVPVFSDASFIEEWFGSVLKCRELSGSRLLSMVPDSWSVSVNPGQDLWMELSPWEVAELRLGTEAIPALVSEHLSASAHPIGIVPLDVVDDDQRVVALRSIAREDQTIETLFLAIEEFESPTSSPLRALLVGVQVAAGSERRFAEVSSRIHQALDPIQIGAEPVKVVFGGSIKGSLALDRFRGCKPVYARPSGLFNRVFARLKLRS